MFHVVVCDDEKIFREELTAWLQRYQEENQVSFCIKEFHEGKELADHMPSQMDILFLDIKMKTTSSLSTSPNSFSAATSRNASGNAASTAMPARR